MIVGSRMRYASICLALAIAAFACGIARQATAEPTLQDAASAAKLFEAGRFAEAGEIYTRLVAQDPIDQSTVLQLGRIALLANRLDDAEKWLERALTLKPDNTDAKIMLAEAFYRGDDFQKAASALDGVDVATNKLVTEQYPTLNVAALQSFKGQTPYELQGDGQVTRLKFVNTTGPLPVVSVRVNGGEEVIFFIDTGGSEVALDTDFAKELGLTQFGEMQGTFSGGEHAKVGQSRIDSFTVGDWTVHNLPVVTLALRQLSAGLGVKRIDGCIGITLLYHFLATLDYPQGRTRVAQENRREPEAVRRGGVGRSRCNSVLDGERPFHGWLGPGGDDAAYAPVRRHRPRRGGREARRVGHQGRRDQARGG